MSQDIIKGFWDENEEAKKLINIINKEYNSISKKVKELNKEEQEIKIIYTILVIYYLATRYNDKINDYRLVINKAKKYSLCMSYITKFFEDFTPSGEKQTYLFNKLKAYTDEFEKEKNIKKNE